MSKSQKHIFKYGNEKPNRPTFFLNLVQNLVPIPELTKELTLTHIYIYCGHLC